MRLGCTTPIFQFSADVRTVNYTPYAIESLNVTYRRLTRQSSIFPDDWSLLKALYLAMSEEGEYQSETGDYVRNIYGLAKKELENRQKAVSLTCALVSVIN